MGFRDFGRLPEGVVFPTLRRHGGGKKRKKKRKRRR